MRNNEYEIRQWAERYIEAKDCCTTLIYIIGFLTVVALGLLAYIIIGGF